jgi:predicted kinase
VILLINGPFGVGKTTVARILVSRLRRSVLFDPERVGWWLRLAGSGHTDFQDDPRWPGHVVKTARVMRVFGGTVVMPITLWRAERFDVIVRGLRAFAPTLTFRLTAEETELRRRIDQDLKQPGARTWRLTHLRPCIEAFSSGDFGVELPTDGLSPEHIALQIESVAKRTQRRGD